MTELQHILFKTISSSSTRSNVIYTFLSAPNVHYIEIGQYHVLKNQTEIGSTPKASLHFYEWRAVVLRLKTMYWKVTKGFSKRRRSLACFKLAIFLWYNNFLMDISVYAANCFNRGISKWEGHSESAETKLNGPLQIHIQSNYKLQGPKAYVTENVFDIVDKNVIVGSAVCTDAGSSGCRGRYIPWHAERWRWWVREQLFIFYC